MDKEFQKCIEEGNASIISSGIEARKKSNIYINNSNYFLKAAQNLIVTDTPNLAVVQGFFAMEHRENALISLEGYDIKSHPCTTICLSRIINRKDLAKELSKASELRIKYNYNLDLKNKLNNEVEEFVNLTVIKFIQEIDKLIEKI